MPLSHEHPDQLDGHLHDTPAVVDLMSDIIGGACQRFPARIKPLIDSGAWTDAALALLELELPQWQLRRLAYDDGEWHCALSRQRELPEWLDQAIESHHADLPLAILGALLEARRQSAPLKPASVPVVPRPPTSVYEPLYCENFA